MNSLYLYICYVFICKYIYIYVYIYIYMYKIVYMYKYVAEHLQGLCLLI